MTDLDNRIAKKVPLYVKQVKTGGPFNMENLIRAWNHSLDLIQGEISDLSFDTWIKDLIPVQRNGGTVFLKASSSLGVGFIEDRYDALIKNALRYSDSTITDVVFITDENEIPEALSRNNQATPLSSENVDLDFNIRSNSLNPKYTFDRFVIGENNRFARAACIAVAESPSQKYNPLFIYGGVGLGKTHLMQAIGNYVIEEREKRRIVYVSCEDFTNEFITSIQNGTSNEFRQKYRSTDILLIDDIQFLAGKVETQEAFFHTFNTLYEANKQIVITSDKPPKEIPKLEERLRSRFEMGLMTDISAPSFETRMAILLKKGENYDKEIPEDVLTFIAEHVHTNIRELEGALTTVTAYANLHGQELTLKVAQNALKDLLQSQNGQIDIPLIKKITADYFDITVEDIDSKRRPKKIAQPRQIAMYLSRKLTDTSFPKIGEMFGGRDHSTVVHACNKIQSDIENSESFKETVGSVEEAVVNSIQ